MVRIVWILVCSLLAVGIELVAGSHGVVLPLFAAVAFCLLVAQGARRALPVLILVGAVLDLAYGRPLPAQAVLLVLLAGVADAWRRHGDCRHPLLQFVPGLAVGTLAAVVLVVLVCLPGGASLGWPVLAHYGWIAVQAVIGGTVLTPLVMALLDGGGKRLGLPLYARARNRQE